MRARDSEDTRARFLRDNACISPTVSLNRTCAERARDTCEKGALCNKVR